tara:strand:- start:5498 stop:6403 length:906 start_codon:yes stop_codon:yes gene_type:complete
MHLIFSNTFIYFGLAILSLFFVTGINDFSFAANFLETTSIDTRLIVMFLLAEPHFAMTLPLLYAYRKNFALKPFYFSFLPIIIIIVSCILFFKLPNFFFLIFLFANVYHVNRQSVGFLKLQAKYKPSLAQIYEVLLHLLTFSCLIVAFVFRSHGIPIAFVILVVAMLAMLVASKILNNSWPKIREIFVISQGFLIFLPIAVFEDILMAFAVGISIHYVQYLVISWSVLRKGFGFSLVPLLLVLIFYSSASTGVLSGLITKERISLIVFIPTLLQLLHFYYDGLIWRRDDELVAKAMKKALS